MSDSVWPHRWQPTRLPRSWDSPGKNTGVGCHSLLQGIFLTQGLNPRISSIAGRLYTVWENHLFWSPFILPSLVDLKSLTSTLTLLLHPYLSHSISHQALCILRKGILNWFLSFPFSLPQQFPQCWQQIKFILQPQLLLLLLSRFSRVWLCVTP